MSVGYAHRLPISRIVSPYSYLCIDFRLSNLHIRKNHKEMFYKHLRKVREMKEGAELKAELHKLTLWIDEDPKLFTGDIIYSILLSYRDIQVWKH